MIKIPKRLAAFLAQQKKWQNLMDAAARKGATAPGAVPPSNRLQEARNFGSNPGNLRMFTYLPPDLSPGAGLMVVLHGCTQSADGYDRGAGWSTLAERFGFALLLPEQQRANNPNGCFNWFQSDDTTRGHGEALSIRQMVARMVAAHGIDPTRVFVTGLSAGGAMTSVMLATYPDVFAGGAIIAGLPYGAATNVQEAFESMFQCRPRAARTWGDLVRAASAHRGQWPRISVWHGEADATVIPANAAEVIKQWTDVHGLAAEPSARTKVDGCTRQVWVNASGDETIESYSIAGMAHGTPLATGHANEQCGAAGPFLLDVGISSSYHIARFFGLAGHPARITLPQRHDPAKDRARSARGGPDQPARETLDADSRTPERPDIAPPPALDIGAVITKALRAAGLMNGR